MNLYKRKSSIEVTTLPEYELHPETQAYIGTKRVIAWPENRVGGDLMSSQPGYAVTYDDGYRSWSPAATFEAAYQPLDQLFFGQAWHALQTRLYSMARRQGWNGQGKDGMSMWVEIQHPDSQSKMTNPYAYMVVAKGDTLTRTPWTPSQLDLCAKDWEVLGGTVMQQGTPLTVEEAKEITEEEAEAYVRNNLPGLWGYVNARKESNTP